MSSDKNTLEKIERAYEKRERIPKERYSFLNPSVFIPWQEKERVFLHFLNKNYFRKKILANFPFLKLAVGPGLTSSNLYVTDLHLRKLQQMNFFPKE